MTGEVVKWEPLGAGMCDVLVREETSTYGHPGRECWYRSSDLQPDDDGGPLPSRAEAYKEADRKGLEQLRAIREAHVRDFNVPWPGLEHGKALFGQMVDGAIEAVEARVKTTR